MMYAKKTLALMVHKCFDKKSADTSDGAIKSEIMSNQELAN